MLRTAIQTASLSITLIASMFLLWGNVGLTPETIASLARSKLDYNYDVAKALSDQYAYTWVGVAQLLLAFCLQMANSLWPMRFKDYQVNKNGAFAGFLVSMLLTIISIFVSQYISSRTMESVKIILIAMG